MSLTSLCFALAFLMLRQVPLTVVLCLLPASALLSFALAKWKKAGLLLCVPCLAMLAAYTFRAMLLLLRDFLLPRSGWVLYSVLSAVPMVLLAILGKKALTRVARLAVPVWGVCYGVALLVLAVRDGEMWNLSASLLWKAEPAYFLPLLWAVLPGQLELTPKQAFFASLWGGLAGLAGQTVSWLVLGDFPAKTLLPALHLTGSGTAYGHLSALAGLWVLPGLLLLCGSAVNGFFGAVSTCLSRKTVKRGLAGLLCLCLLPLSGCDGTEPGEQIFALNLALDVGKGSTLRLTLQYPQITPTGKSETDETTSKLLKNGYQIEQTESETLEGCLTAMRMITPRQVSLMQLHGIFFGESLVSDGELFAACVEAISELGELRPTAMVFMARGRAEDVLSRQTPQFGARLSKSHDAQKEVLLSLGIMPEVRLTTFLKDFAERERTPLLALSAVNGEQYVETEPPHGEESTAYLAGDLPRNAVTQIDYCGCAVLTDTAPLLLNGYETQLLSLLKGELKEAEGTRATKKPRFREEDGAIIVKLTLKGDSAEKLRQDALSLLQKFTDYGVDPLGIGLQPGIELLME